MSEVAIRVEHLSKAYLIGLRDESSDTLVGSMRSWLRDPGATLRQLRRLDTTAHQSEAADVLWALRDVSFDVREGEVVGIIGRNGAGKSTLLKILSRITEPTSGRVVIRGRVASLLEVGTGFHPELTGRENVYMNGTILGMKKREIDRRFGAIVDFSGVEKFLDTPIKRYSSGMKVRLAFAVAAHLDPEIFIIDEVLAVGDADFQKRCLDRIEQLARSGRTILFVSHNLDIIPRFCGTGILLQEGQVAQRGASRDVVEAFIRSITPLATIGSKHRSGDGRARFVAAGLVDAAGMPKTVHPCGDDLTVRVAIESTEDISDAALAINVVTLSGTKIVSSWSREFNHRIDLHRGIQYFDCTFRSLALRPGHKFAVQLWAEAVTILDSIDQSLVFSTELSRHYPGIAASADQGCMVTESIWSEPDRVAEEASAESVSVVEAK